MKKVLSLGIVSAIALSTLAPFTQAAEMTRRLGVLNGSGSGKVIDIVCAGNAVATREASVLSAYQTLSNTLVSELNLRAK